MEIRSKDDSREGRSENKNYVQEIRNFKYTIWLRKFLYKKQWVSSVSSNMTN